MWNQGQRERVDQEMWHLMHQWLAKQGTGGRDEMACTRQVCP